MSVTETYEPVLLETDGSETDFDFDFSVFAGTDVVVALVDPDTLEVLDTPELGVDYTVTLNTSTVGGTVVFGTAPADDQLVSIRRNIPTTQSTDIPSGGLFRESQIENALDKAILLIQQLEESVSRALLQSPYSEALDLQFPAPVAGTVLGWNSAEDGLENKTPNTEAYITKASTAMAEAGTDNSSYMTSLKTDEAIQARKTRVATLSITANHLSTDGSLYDVVDCEVDDDFTLDNPTNPVNGQKFVWRLKQDGSGSHVITLDTKFTVASEISSVVLSTAASAIDHIGAIYNETDDAFEVVAFSSEQA